VKLTVNQSTHTYSEIMRQFSGWKKILHHLEKKGSKNLKIMEKYADAEWIFTGCGTSYYLAQTASLLFENLTGIPSRAVPSSEIIIFPQTVFNSRSEYLAVPISRSGTSTEVIMAARTVKNNLKIPTLVVSCTPDSILVKEAVHSVTFPFEKEESVVMTGSFTSMLLSMVHLAAWYTEDRQLMTKMSKLADTSETLVQNSEAQIKDIAFVDDIEDFVFLGQGPYYGIANEAALKIQEMSLSHSQSFHALEYRHGPKSTATASTLLTLLFSENGLSLEADLLKDLKKLDAKTLALTSAHMVKECHRADYIIDVPPGYNDILTPFLYMPMLQLLGYYKAIAKHLNPDNPRNLSAVVEFNLSENG
jgi:glucosamine--fructose-6-phosphate aminotransferase (isomerizing)